MNAQKFDIHTLLAVLGLAPLFSFSAIGAIKIESMRRDFNRRLIGFPK